MKNNSFILKGNICYSKSLTEILVREDSYLICQEGVSKGVHTVIPKQYKELPVIDYGSQIIIPGLTDLHVHAPQFPFRALGMDMELLDWLNSHAFPEEAKYADQEYAAKSYEIFVDDMKRGATTRACIFGTRHVEATETLMDLLEDAGISAYVGKVNMDRNAPEYLAESSAGQSAKDTLLWLDRVAGKHQQVKPMLTPRFIPSCTDELMEMLKEIQVRYHLPVQSHLSENEGEIAWVKELCPWSGCYGEAYDKFGLFGGLDCKTVMAHCVHSGEEETALMKKNGVYVAHCPQSNMNLSSGIAPIRSFLEQGLNVGLGSDVAGGSSSSIFRAMTDAIQVSKLRWRLVDQSLKPLTLAEAFYLGTKGGGSFFGKAGSFEEGYELDAVVLDDTNLYHPQEITTEERLERMIYLSDERNIRAKYVSGKQIW